MSTGDFVAQSFHGDPTVNKLWLDAEIQATASEILGHPYRGLRIRYWRLDDDTAWVLEEVGKEMPITIGVAISNNAIADVRILAYRESRGSEVRHGFFTSQFDGLKLRENTTLNERIDGISGATLSVRAVTNISRFALFLHQHVTSSDMLDRP